MLNMKSTSSNSSKKKTSEYTWSSTIEDLLGKKSQKTTEKLNAYGITTLEDLLWIFPLRVMELPPVQEFSKIQDGMIFIGRGSVINIQAKPNFRIRGKGRALLYNIVVTVKDAFSNQYLTLRWFNTYGSVKQKLEKLNLIEFMGETSFFADKAQVVNPEIFPLESFKDESNFQKTGYDLKIQYPTINSISGIHVKKIIDQIPSSLWDNIEEILPQTIIEKRNLFNLKHAFKILHAKIKPDDELQLKAENRLIYNEFFIDQIKILLRRRFLKKPLAHSLKISEEILNKYVSFFPYDLTTDQNKCLNEVKKDLAKDEPMMRMVQGDVGCGKTSIAFLAAAITIENHFQTALMCPTEALALQHFLSAEEFFQNTPVRIGLLLGSTSAKEKKIINKKLVDGEIDLIIGTHSLFQESVQFKSLALAIIDEQHKFGVEQRISLINKGQGTHCLIMSATPIPRSLSLTRYGDLDISIIRSMPAGRKGHKTRIVTPDTFSQYLSFIKTRLSMKEQVYIVVPAINESVEQEIHHLESALESYTKYFPEFRIKGLHGQMKSDEKQSIFKEFKNHEFDLLVSTSVIEVGINVPNATIMSILNPERFGLSSLHQLRGRVGRGDKTGFCFLVTDKQLATTSLERLKVIENHTDGFLIAEEDLKLRGEGDLFGKEQSGSQQRKLANLILHFDLLEDARVDLEEALKKNDPIIEAQIAKISKDAKIFNTI